MYEGKHKISYYDSPKPRLRKRRYHGVWYVLQGSSIELSADAPMREPYIVYFQGGLTASHSRAGVVFALQEMFDEGLVSSPSLRA